MLILQDLELSPIEKEALAKNPSFLLVIFTQLDLPFDKQNGAMNNSMGEL